MTGSTSRIITSIMIVMFVLVAGVFGLPSISRAERTVGVIMTGDIIYFHNIHNALMKATKGNDLKFVVQVPSPEPMAWSNAARKLVVLGVDVIVTYGAPATLTVMKETASIPIIYAGVYDPEKMNIPGKNATGISSKIPMEDLLKRLGSIKKFSKLGVIFNKTEKDTILQVLEIKKFEAGMGFKSVLFDARKKDTVPGIKGVDAILMTTSCAAICQIADIVKVARGLKIATAASITGGEEAGILLTLSASSNEQGRVAGEMLLKILKGDAVSSIAQKAPLEFDYTVNLREAGVLGLTIPGTAQGGATRVIK